jgi:integrase
VAEGEDIMITFTEQADILIERLRTRKRNPIKDSSLESYRSYSRRWIVPLLGSTCLAEFTPVAMKGFIEELSVSLGPKSVNEIVSLTKQIVASVTDNQGLPMYPRVWDSEFIDLPIVKHAEQDTPIFSRAQVEAMIATSDETYRCLFALAASSGLRIGELLAIKLAEDGVSTVFDASGVIRVRQSLWRGRPQAPKTSASVREVEIPMQIAAMLREFAGNRTGYLFGNGRSLDVSSARSRLEKHVGAGCFHAFRRYRTTVLRKARCHEELIKTWLGHRAVSSVTDLYSRVSSDETFRREECERVGLGFELRQPTKV